MSAKCPIARMRCPESADGCPCWQELVQENAQTGETRVLKDCLFRLLPLLMLEVVKASNRPAAALHTIQEHMVKGLGAIASSVQHATQQRLEQKDGRPVRD